MASNKSEGPNFGYAFENCRYCVLGCGKDHSVFYGFIECGTHKANRMSLLQAQYERDRQPDGLPGVTEQNGKKVLEWQCTINGKLVKSCKLMATYNTESYLEPPAELKDQIARARGETTRETQGQPTKESGNGDISGV
ncbi:hypothetical protein DV736_g3111, partial [Chaetothyriales sp. CBS 134916]